MRPTLRREYLGELTRFAEATGRGDVAAAWSFLERAHILSQSTAGAHVWVHLRMFVFSFRQRDWPECVGQLPRLLLAAPGSWLGRAPRGNTGRSNVGIFRPMEISAELEELLREDRP